MAIANLALLQLNTDFWSQPMLLTTRFGVAGYELMILCLLSTVLLVPAYLLNRSGRKLAARMLAMVCILPVLLVLVAGWSFYGHFDRFIGVYAVQMILQDGGQLFRFLGKMPSSVNWTMIAASAGLLLFIGLILFWRSRPMRGLCSGLSAVGAVLLAFSVVASGLWNHPEAAEPGTDLRARKTLERVKESEYLLLSARSGPFTEIANSLSTMMLAEQPDLSVDVSKLDRRRATDTASEKDVTPYNVVYMVVESLHPQILEAYGGNPAIMPAVNEIAEKAFVFDRAFSQASHSNYADVSALSGQYPLRSMNIHFYPKDPSYPKSLPYDRLSPLNYKTGLFSSQNERWGLMENYLMSDSVDMFSHVGTGDVEKKGSYGGIEVIELKDGIKQISYNDYMYQGTGNEIERLDGETTNIALDWLSSLDEDDPFFMYFNFQASHTPFNALPDDFEPAFFTEQDEHASRVRQGFTDNVPLDYVMKAYWDALHYVDQNVEKVVDYLKETGRHENTIYVITADTSIRFSPGLIGNGGDLFPDVLKVPVVIALPDLESQVLATEPVEQIDIMPSVLSAIGVGPHPASQGVNVLENRDPERIVYAVAQTPASHQYSAIYRDWQLLHDYNTDKYTINYIGGTDVADEDRKLSPEGTARLMRKLNEWKTAQIAYYADPAVHGEYYPPNYRDERWLKGSAGRQLTESSLD